MFPMLLRNTPLWPALGNHDALSAVSESERGVYFDIFSLPRDGRAGGVASNSEAYYSFDYANVHFLVLDSEARRVRPGEPMLVWADADLAATTQPWIIAYWHQAPYTKGTHDSDGKIDSGGRPTEIREFVLPLLERRGVDLVLTGHSHVYERSSLIDGHYGFSQSFDSETHVRDASDGCVCSGSCPACAKGGTGPYRKGNRSPNGHGGTVYAVVGSSSKGPDHGPIADPHPAMVISLRRHGSMVIDVTGPRLDARWIQRGGTIRDHFTILKKDGHSGRRGKLAWEAQLPTWLGRQQALERRELAKLPLQLLRLTRAGQHRATPNCAQLEVRDLVDDRTIFQQLDVPKLDRIQNR
jgi:hypothetical protein